MDLFDRQLGSQQKDFQTRSKALESTRSIFWLENELLARLVRKRASGKTPGRTSVIS